MRKFSRTILSLGLAILFWGGVYLIADLAAQSHDQSNVSNVAQHVQVTYADDANGDLATQALFVANRAYQVTAIRQVHSTAGTDGGSVTVSVSKDTGTQAPGAGTGLLTAAFNLKAAINTVQTGSLSSTEADLKLAAGDRLAVVFGGTLTAVAGVVVTIELQVL